MSSRNILFLESFYGGSHREFADGTATAGEDDTERTGTPRPSTVSVVWWSACQHQRKTPSTVERRRHLPAQCRAASVDTPNGWRAA